jgi:hypothetical protein
MQEKYARVREAVRELAEMEYPKVWVGEVGMTPDEAAAEERWIFAEQKEWWEEATSAERDEAWTLLAEDEREGYDSPPASWDDLPDVLKQELLGRWKTPETSEEWIDGLSVYESGLHRHIDPHVKAELSEAVRVIHHAKHGRVPVTESWDIEFKEMDELDVEGGDIGVAKAFTPDGKILVPMTPNYRYVRVEDLTSEDVDDALLDYLECYSMDGPNAMGEFVIEDTPEAQAAVERRLEAP